ncbi:MAG TPA: hypothetical protein VJU83_09295 [Burkholderiales bacterium]|nr:hypothetical protein [Burkholderiales bacterium]
MLFHVYKEDVPEGHYLNEPTGIYRTLLDADWLLYVLMPLLFIIIVAGLMYAWHLHEIPKHKADHKKMRQAELVSVLTLLGMFQHWVWAIALFIAYVDWDAIEDALTRILRNSRKPVPETPPGTVLIVPTSAVVAPPVEVQPPQVKPAEGPAA